MALEAAFIMTLDRISTTSMGKKGRDIILAKDKMYQPYLIYIKHLPSLL
jgi:hypothetical protein